MRRLGHILISFILYLTAMPLQAQSSCSIVPNLPFYSDHLRASAEKTDTITLRFIGDVMLHSAQLQNSRTKEGTWDFSSYLEDIKDELSEADLAVANMEFTLGGEPYSGYPAFSSPDAYANYVVDCGIDVLLTANNHILDKGIKGLRRTLSYYESLERSRNIIYTGCSMPEDKDRYPLLVMVKGVKVAIVNFTYGTNVGGETKDSPIVFRQDEKSILAALKRAKEADADIIIALPHWGQEYQLKHSRSQEKWAHFLAENGADVIIGAHPHVVQDHEVITSSDGREVPVYYSMGNAVSNMSAVNTQLELMVTVRLTKKYPGDCKLLEVSHDYLWCSRPGFLCSSFKTIKVTDYLGKRGLWRIHSEYDKMKETYTRLHEEDHYIRRD